MMNSRMVNETHVLCACAVSAGGVLSSSRPMVDTAADDIMDEGCASCSGKSSPESSYCVLIMSSSCRCPALSVCNPYRVAKMCCREKKMSITNPPKNP